MFSIRPLGEIEELIREHDRERGRRMAQRELARTMTAWIHDPAVVPRVEGASRVMFGDSLDGLTDADLGVLAGTVPTVDVPRGELATGVGIVDLLARTIADSKGAARRLVTQGGAYINNQRITELEHQVTLAHLATETMLVVRGGKKEYCLVRVV
jgi:tyrosyl-tRNA synthetase